jgi:hypothetical protein
VEPVPAAHVRQIGFAVTPAWALQGIGSLWWVLSERDVSVSLAHGFLAVSIAPTAIGAMPIPRRLDRLHDDDDINQLGRWH